MVGNSFIEQDNISELLLSSESIDDLVKNLVRIESNKITDEILNGFRN